MSGRDVLIPGYEDGEYLVFMTPHAKFPLRCRRENSSDGAVFYQIFAQREYSCLDDLVDAQLILDCGAYVGYSTAYFLTRFPSARVFAVEPDPTNFQLLCRNLAGYGDAVTIIRSALWSHIARLRMSEIQYRDGMHWARQVRECKPHEAAEFDAIDVAGLLALSGQERISILKMDIEGAEAVVFANNYQPWIDRVDNIVIELHNDSCFGNASAVFANAIAGRGFTISRYGELTVCRGGANRQQ